RTTEQIMAASRMPQTTTIVIWSHSGGPDKIKREVTIAPAKGPKSASDHTANVKYAPTPYVRTTSILGQTAASPPRIVRMQVTAAQIAASMALPPRRYIHPARTAGTRNGILASPTTAPSPLLL